MAYIPDVSFSRKAGLSRTPPANVSTVVLVTELLVSLDKASLYLESNSMLIYSKQAGSARLNGLFGMALEWLHIKLQKWAYLQAAATAASFVSECRVKEIWNPLLDPVLLILLTFARRLQPFVPPERFTEVHLEAPILPEETMTRPMRDMMTQWF